MTRLLLDSGAVSRLARPSFRTDAIFLAIRQRGLWPPIVPTVVIVESSTGRVGADANTNRLLAMCDVVTDLPVAVARRAGQLRHLAHRGSPVDAIVVALAEPNGFVLTGDLEDLGALAARANGVRIERI